MTRLILIFCFFLMAACSDMSEQRFCHDGSEVDTVEELPAQKVKFIRFYSNYYVMFDKVSVVPVDDMSPEPLQQINIANNLAIQKGFSWYQADGVADIAFAKCVNSRAAYVKILDFKILKFREFTQKDIDTMIEDMTN